MFFTHLLIPLIGVFLVFLSFIVFTRAQKYLKKEKRISEIEDQYERLRSSRRDFLVNKKKKDNFLLFFVFL